MPQLSAFSGPPAFLQEDRKKERESQICLFISGFPFFGPIFGFERNSVRRNAAVRFGWDREEDCKKFTFFSQKN